MKNYEMIKKAFAEFNLEAHDDCQKTLDRIKKNFEIEHDEVRFEIKAKITQPNKEIADKLIADGHADWLGDATYRVTEAYLKHDLKICILFKAIFPYAIDYVDDDDEEGIEHYLMGHYHFDADGEIASSASNGGRHTESMRREVRQVIDKWLSAEFGRVDAIY